MAITDLLKVVTPPSKTREAGDDAKWASAVKALGTEFPPDFRDYVSRYGSGSFNDPGRLVIDVLNPCAKGFSKEFKAWAAGAKEYFDESEVLFGDDDARTGLPVFPVSPGLMPWGRDDNGNQMFWYTKGVPRRWPTVFHAHDSDLNLLQRFDMSMTTFLARAFNRKLTVSGAWGKPFFTGPRKVKFASSRSEIEY